MNISYFHFCMYVPPHSMNYFADTAVTPFDPDSNFTMRALTLIEAMNIPVMTGLDEYAGHIRIMLGATHMASEMQRAYLMSEPFTTMTSLRSMQIFDGSKALFFDWLIGGGKLSPTWRNLLHIIREVHLDDLANQVETYLKVATKNEDSEEKERTIVDGETIVLLFYSFYFVSKLSYTYK